MSQRSSSEEREYCSSTSAWHLTSSKFFPGLVHGDHYHFSCESDERTGTHSKRDTQAVSKQAREPKCCLPCDACASFLWNSAFDL